MDREENNRKIQKAITEVVAFFDLFDYPLTTFEIWQYLSIKCELSDILNALEGVEAGISTWQKEKGIIKKNAFYFLIGREEIVNTRNKRYNYTDRKIKRAILVSRLFKFIPWIKMIAIGNIIGAHNLKNKSDIDFFIITKNKRLWITRIFCVAIVKFLRLRPTPGKEKDKICLSFFVSEEGADLRNLILKSYVGDDIYFSYWLAGLLPIYARKGIYNNFIVKNNWIFNFLPNWIKGEVNYKRNLGKSYSLFYRDVIDMFFGGLDPYVKKIQLKILPNTLKEKMNKDTRVVISDDIAKLHSYDKREEYLKDFKIKLVDINLKNKLKRKTIDEIISEFSKKLPKFKDRRIDYSSSGIAPVINCFVRHNNKILLLKRSDKVLAYKNMWNSVGGFLDEPKSVEEKIKEEIRKELGISMNKVEKIKVEDYYEYDDKEICRKWIINPAIVDLKEKVEIKLDFEHSEYRWINPKDMKNYNTIPDLDKCLKRVL